MKKNIYRSKTSKIISGVCGGIAEYFDIDPILVRILFIVLLLADGISLLLYLILWIIMPNADKARLNDIPNADVVDNESNYSNDTTNVNNYDHDDYLQSLQRRRSILGISLIIIGVILLLSHYVDFSILKDMWPVILVVAGIFLLIVAFYHKKGSKNENI